MASSDEQASEMAGQPATQPLELKIGPSPAERRLMRAELLETGESKTLEKLRSRLQKERAGIIGGLFKGDGATPNRLEAVVTLLSDNRAALDSLAREVDAIHDSRHAVLMANLAEASNKISERSLQQAVALKRATWALVAVTAVLILATLVAAILAAG